MQFVQIFPLILLVSFVNSFRPPLRSSSRAMRRKTQREQKRIEQIERSRKCYYTERIYSNECPNLLINYKNIYSPAHTTSTIDLLEYHQNICVNNNDWQYNFIGIIVMFYMFFALLMDYCYPPHVDHYTGIVQ